MEQNYPSLKESWRKCGFSVLAQENHNIRVAIDQWGGEQTINKDAKTVGMILFFQNIE